MSMGSGISVALPSGKWEKRNTENHLCGPDLFLDFQMPAILSLDAHFLH